MSSRIRLRRDTAANWTAANPILALGEPGAEIDITGKITLMKIGDGVNRWNDLDYTAQTGPAGPQGEKGDTGEYSNADTLIATSSETKTIQTGTLTLTIESGKDYSPGMIVMVAHTSDPVSSNMIGMVVSYSSTTLVVDVEDVVGNGSHTGWTVSFASGSGFSESAHAAIDHEGLPGVSRNVGYNVLDYGAKGDGRFAFDGVTTASSTTLTSATASFTSNDTGKMIIIRHAGPNRLNLQTTVTYVNPTTVTLANAASISLTAAEFCIGTDDSAAIQAIIDTYATRRSLINMVFRNQKKVNVIFPSDKIFMIGTGIAVSSKDDVYFTGSGLIVFSDIKAITFTLAKYCKAIGLNMDGMSANLVTHTPANCTAIAIEGTVSSIVWWNKSRGITVNDNTIVRVKNGIIGNDDLSTAGVEFIALNNKLKCFNITGSVGMRTPLSDSVITTNKVNGFQVNFDVNIGPLQLVNNHDFPSFGHIYGTANTTASSSVLTSVSATQFPSDWIENLADCWIYVSTGFASTGPFRIVSATSTTLTLDATATGSTTGAIISSAATTLTNLKISTATAVDIMVQNNLFDICTDQNILIETDGHGVVIQNNVIRKHQYPSAKMIYINPSSSTSLADLDISNNYFENLEGTSTLPITLGSNVQTANGYPVTSQCHVAENHFGVNVTEISWPDDFIRSSKLTVGKLTPLVLPVNKTGCVEIDCDTATGDIGMIMSSTGSTGKAKMWLENYGSSPGGFASFQGNGTKASPTQITSQLALFQFVGWGYNADNSAFDDAVRMTFRSSQQWTATAEGTECVISVTPNNSTAMVESFTFRNNGEFTPIGGIRFADNSVLTTATTISNGINLPFFNHTSTSSTMIVDRLNVLSSFVTTAYLPEAGSEDSLFVFNNSGGTMSLACLDGADHIHGEGSTSASSYSMPDKTGAFFISYSNSWYLVSTSKVGGGLVSQSDVLGVIDDESDSALVLRAATDTAVKLQVNDTDGNAEFTVKGNGDIGFYNNANTLIGGIVDGKFTMGKTTPDAEFQLASTSTAASRGMIVSQHSDGGNGAQILLRKSDGTPDSPTVLDAAATVSAVWGQGYVGSNGWQTCGGTLIVQNSTIPVVNAAYGPATDVKFYSGKGWGAQALRMTAKWTGAISFEPMTEPVVGAVGDMYMTTAGVLKVCTVAGILSTATNRANSTAYSLGDVRKWVTGTTSYICITAGTSAGSEPSAASSVGSSVTDGSVVWACISLTNTASTWTSVGAQT